MTRATLVIGNKNYSSWSMRAWVFLRAFEFPFQEHQESLNGADLSERLARHSPSKKVPVLLDGAFKIWDSLAICHYVSHRYLEGRGWPQQPEQFGMALAISQEMHASFVHLRAQLPMNCRARRRMTISPELAQDISRIDNIWSQCRKQCDSQSLWLFDTFSIADCMFAPVASRFLTYSITLSEAAMEYRHNLLAHPAVTQWLADAAKEKEVVSADEAGEICDDLVST